MANHTKSDTSGYVFTMDSEGLQKFVSEKEGALSFIEQLRGGAKSRWPYAQVRGVILALIKEPEHRVYQAYEIPGGEYTVLRARRLPEDGKWILREEDLGDLLLLIKQPHQGAVIALITLFAIAQPNVK